MHPKKMTDNLILLILATLISYTTYCVVDIIAYPAVTIQRQMITVLDKNSIVKTMLPGDYSIVEAKSTDKIIVEFKVTRTHYAENSVERIFETIVSPGEIKEEVLYYITRNQVPGTNIIVSEYDLPDNTKPGCNYVIYSRNNIKYRFNLLQKLTGTTVDTPKIIVCITA